LIFLLTKQRLVTKKNKKGNRFYGKAIKNGAAVDGRTPDYIQRVAVITG
jgi:hypothetical protein